MRVLGLLHVESREGLGCVGKLALGPTTEFSDKA